MSILEYSKIQTKHSRSEVGSSTCFSQLVNCPSLETEVTSRPTRPVENIVITTKGLQDIRWDDGEK